jgi:hypothetical protein
MPSETDHAYRLALLKHEEVRRVAARHGPIRTVKPPRATVPLLTRRPWLPGPARSSLNVAGRVTRSAIRTITLAPQR